MGDQPQTGREIKSEQEQHKVVLPDNPEQLEREKKPMANLTWLVPVLVGVIMVVILAYYII